MIIIIVLLLRKPKAPKNPGRGGYDDDYGDYEGGRKNRKSEPKKAQKTGKSEKAPERRAASRPAARGDELFDEEEEEIQIPRRRPEAAETCRPAAKRREAVRTENVPERTDTPERPVRKKNAVRGKSNLLTAFFGCRVLETNYWQQFFSGIRTVYQIDLKRKIWMKKKKV